MKVTVMTVVLHIVFPILIHLTNLTSANTMPPENLETVIQVLGMKMIAIFCNWSKAEFSQLFRNHHETIFFNPDQDAMSLMPHLHEYSSDPYFKSVIICVEHKDIELLNSDELDPIKSSINKRLILYEDNGLLNSVIENFSIPINHHINVFNVKDYLLEDIYEIKNTIFRHKIGRIAPFDEEALSKTLRELREAKRDLNGIHLRAFVELQVPFMLPIVGQDIPFPPGNSEFEDVTGQVQGMFLDVLNLLSKELNFTFSTYRRRDMVWGNYYQNGSFDGMLKNLRNGEGDILASSLTLTLERSNGISFLVPLATQHEGIFIKNTGHEEVVWDLFITPLTQQTWAFIIVTTAALAVVFRMLKLYQDKGKFKPGKELLLVCRCFVRSLGAYFGGADLSKASHQTALRFLTYGIIMAGNITFLSYQASLTSALAVIQTVKPFHSMETLLDSDYMLTITGGTNQENNFKIADDHDSTFYKIYTQKMKPMKDDYRVSNNYEGMNRLLKSHEKLAYFDDIEGMAGYTHVKNCSVVTPWKSNFPKYMSMAFPQNSPYLGLFKDTTIKLFESGVIDLLRSKWQEETVNCFLQAGAEAEQIGFAKLMCLFALLGGACALSIVIMYFEWAYAQFDKENKGKKSDMKHATSLPELSLYKAKCDKIWNGYASPYHIAVQLRRLADDITMT